MQHPRGTIDLHCIAVGLHEEMAAIAESISILRKYHDGSKVYQTNITAPTQHEEVTTEFRENQKHMIFPG